MADIDYRALRRRAETDLKRQKTLTRWVLFTVNLMMYLLFVFIAWGIFLSSGLAKFTPNIPGVSQQDPLTAAMILLTVVGGIGLMFQFISALLDTRIGEAKMREQVMGRLLADEMLRLGEEDELEQEKAKHVMRLSDEGELEEDEAEADAPLVVQRRGRRD